MRRLRFEHLEQRQLLAAVIGNNISVGADLRNYRLAIAATGEYTQFFGTQAAAFSAIQTFVADLNALYEREFAIHFNLVSGTNVVHANPLSDPYGDNSNLSALLAANQTSLDLIIGSANYDIGHVFGILPPGSGGSGLASLGGVGKPGFKAQGASTFDFPTGSDFLALAAHEIGHQFNAEHTFNFQDGQFQRVQGNAYEPASGSTLMSYAGLFPGNNLQPDPDQYFHGASFEQVQTYISAGPGLPNSTTNNTNAVPNVAGGTDFTIPARTPFKLTAVGTDTDATDTLTYTWEQLDIGPADTLPLSGANSGPLFRSFTPSADPSRTFPRLSDLLANINTAAIGEVLPTLSRSMNFRVTVRDGQGGVDSDDVLLTVVDTGVPFAVTDPNTAETWTGATSETIAWNVAGTTGGGINTANVKISLSTDGGLTFPFVLLASTANDGSEAITVPNINTAQARIKVEAVGNIFFDVSNVNFAIAANAGTAGFSIVESLGSTRPIEGAATDSYTIGPNTDPAGSVTVAVTSSPQTLISTDGVNYVAALNLVFNSTATQTVHVRAVNDAVNEGPHTSLITHEVTTGTATYPAGMLINSVVAQVMDDELPPVVGVDFDFASLGNPPPGWTEFEKGNVFPPETLTNLSRDDGVSTNIDVSFDYDEVGFSSLAHTAGALDSTKPLHVPSIRDIDGFNAATIPINITWSDLVPGKSYGVYVFGLENDPARSYGQTVTVTGGNVVSYTQDLTDGILRINDELGTSSRTLKSYEDIVTATAGGTIQVRVVPLAGRFGYALGGVAIREIPENTPGFTVVQSGGTTQVSEAGPSTDTFTVKLNTQPTSNVVINVTSGDTTEATVNPTSLTFTPANWETPQTVTVTGVDDALVDGNQVSTITLAIDDPTSADEYDPVPNQTVSVTTLDDEVPPAITTVQLISGDLVVTDTSNAVDNLIVTRVGANIRIHDPAKTLTAVGAGPIQVNANTVDVPFASVADDLILDTLGGADTVTLDFGGGNPIPVGGVSYTGGAPTGAPGDRLVLKNGTFLDVDFIFSNSTDGTIVLDPDGAGGVAASFVFYFGLDPITSTITAADVSLSYGGGAETITVQQSSVDPSRTEVLSTAGESVDFVNPTVALSIFAQTGDDTININSFGTGGGGFKAALRVHDGSGVDTINLNTSLTVGSATSTGDVWFTAETINLTGNISTDGDTAAGDAGRVDLEGAVVLKANISIDTDAATTDRAVIFYNTVNADDAAAHDRTLTVNAGTAGVLVDGHIGNLQALADLDVTGTMVARGNITVNDGPTQQTVTITGQLQYDPPGNNKSIVTNGAAADHHFTVTGALSGDGTIPVALSMDAGSATVQVGSFGGVQPFADLDVTAGLIRIGGVVRIETEGGHTATFNGPVQLDANVTFDVDVIAAGPDNNLVFNSTVNADAAASNRTLTVLAATGNVTFSGAVGNTQVLRSLTIFDAANFNAAAIGLQATAAASLSITNTGTASAITGAVTGTGATLTKAGAGTLNLGGTNTYTGATTISGGRLNINGSVTSNVSVLINGTLGGTGTITGAVSGAGMVAPGLSPGVLTINGNFTPTGTVQLEAATPYTTAGTHFDRLVVNGAVNLSGASLSFIGAGGAASSGQVITFIANDLVDATTAAANPANGSTVTIGGQQFTLQYNGGDGNDVVLVAPTIFTTTVELVSGNAVVTDIGNKADQLVISRNGNNLRVFDEVNTLQALAGATQVNANTVDIPLANITGNIQVNTLGGSDLLTVDFEDENNPLVAGGLVYTGGDPTAAPGDRLVLARGTFTLVTHNFTSANAGSIVLTDFGTITYTGLEPVDTTGSTITDLVLNLPSSADTAFLEDDGTTGNVTSRIRSSPVTFETFSFQNPSVSLTINGGGGNDTININGFDSIGFRAALTIDGDAGTGDVVNLNAALALGGVSSTGNVNITAEMINLAANIATDGDTAGADAGSVLLTGATVLKGNIAIDTNAATTDNSVTFAGTVAADDSAANNRTLNIDAGTGTVDFMGDVGFPSAVTLADLDVAAGLIRIRGRVGVGDQGGNTATLSGPVQIAGANMQLNAPGNNVEFLGTINADDAVANDRVFAVFAQSILVNSAIGNTQPFAQVLLSSPSLIRLRGNITASDGSGPMLGVDLFGPVQLENNITINTNGASDRNIVFRAAVNADNAGTNDRTLTIDAGTAGVLALGPIGNSQALADLDVIAGIFGAGGNITVNDGPAATATFSGDLAITGVSAVTINMNGTNDHGLTVGGRLAGDAVPQNTAVTIDAGTATVQLGAVGVGTIPNPPNPDIIAALADLDITAGLIRLLGNVVIDDQGGNTATFNGPVELGADVSFDLDAASGADNNVQFASPVNADSAAAQNRKLSIGAGSGTVQFAAVGNTQPLADLDVTASLIRLGATVRVDDQGGNTVTFDGPVELAGTGLMAVDVSEVTQNNNVIFTSTINADDAATQNRLFLVAAGGATAHFQGAIGNLQPLAGFNVATGATGLIRLGANVTVTDGTVVEGVNFIGRVQLEGNIAIVSDGPSADHPIIFNFSINADNSATQDRTLTLNTGTTGAIVVGAIGDLQPLADLDFTGSVFGIGASMVVNDGATPQTVSIAGDLGVVTPVNASTIVTNGLAADHSIVVGGRLIADDSAAQNVAVTIDAGTATVQLGGVGDTTDGRLADLDITAGLIRLLGNVVIDDQGGTTSTFNGPVELAADVSFDLDAATGADNSVTFSGPVASDATARDLTVAAGGGNVAFAEAVGTAPGHLDLLTVSSAALAEFDSTVRANNVSLTATTVRLQNNVTALADDVAIFGNAVLDGNVVLTSGGGAGDDVAIAGATNADAAASNRTLTAAAGLGSVTLAGALGNAQALAAVTVTGAELTAGAIGLTAAGALSVTNTGPLSAILGAITGAGATLTKAGAGTLRLAGASTYTGATTISAGRLNVNGSITSNVTVAGP
ncbi:MAG: M12 family metallo-peptidase, partial [Planctomycetaceae bacterium]|nr:M12 family metallo-peptidase [Planctomycetaceae bacterium]